MSVATFDINRELVTVTAAAAEHFRRSLAGSGRAGVRISVKESGCTGFKYVLDESDAPAAGDLRLELANGVLLFIDPGALSFLRGTEIDYAREVAEQNGRELVPASLEDMHREADRIGAY